MDFENMKTRLGRAWNTEGVGIDFDTTLDILQSVQSNIIDEVAWLVEGMHPKSLPDTYSESDDCISRQQIIDLLQVVKIDLQSKPNAPHYQKKATDDNSRIANVLEAVEKILHHQLQKAREDIKRDINYIHYNLRNAIRNEKDGLNVKGYEGEIDKWLNELSKATHSELDQDKV